MKNVMLIIFLLFGAFFTRRVEDACNKQKFQKLRTKELTMHTTGEITKVAESNKNKMIVYSYNFSVRNKLYKDIFRMKKKYNGIVAGSPIGVIYLKKDPKMSRLVFTEEDLSWIK